MGISNLNTGHEGQLNLVTVDQAVRANQIALKKKSGNITGLKDSPGALLMVDATNEFNQLGQGPTGFGGSAAPPGFQSTFHHEGMTFQSFVSGSTLWIEKRGSAVGIVDVQGSITITVPTGASGAYLGKLSDQLGIVVYQDGSSQSQMRAFDLETFEWVGSMRTLAVGHNGHSSFDVKPCDYGGAPAFVISGTSGVSNSYLFLYQFDDVTGIAATHEWQATLFSYSSSNRNVKVDLSLDGTIAVCVNYDSYAVVDMTDGTVIGSGSIAYIQYPEAVLAYPLADRMVYFYAQSSTFKRKEIGFDGSLISETSETYSGMIASGWQSSCWSETSTHFFMVAGRSGSGDNRGIHIFQIDKATMTLEKQTRVDRFETKYNGWSQPFTCFANESDGILTILINGYNTSSTAVWIEFFDLETHTFLDQGADSLTGSTTASPSSSYLNAIWDHPSGGVALHPQNVVNTPRWFACEAFAPMGVFLRGGEAGETLPVLQGGVAVVEGENLSSGYGVYDAATNDPVGKKITLDYGVAIIE